jgi:S-adenosylmethionine hydrolase
VFEEIDPAYGEMYDVVIRNNDEVAWEGSLPYAKSFGDVPLGDNLLFVNSSGNTSIAVNQGSFANKYGIGEGDSWTIEIRKH